ncbi:phosphotransferase family protein [Streptomyces triticirhizae]|uniref:Aminoglycoside phosphotransferase family protein n=1 Tax=Streptomyces triticirhizae TaxID=2483353 RepID=A0A3M2MCT5_9ACTN|nr:aminoglycoside phosphotransferase family protein [Streptomyces triticirhizae]RMI46703.1 aminoglycoside phosphotransferase family protein [Streptomyces triticirhizae]
MTDPRVEASFALLRRIAAAAGLSAEGAQPIRLGENDLWRLPKRVVVRIARAGQDAAAAREVAVTRWLAEHHVPAVRPLPIEQPVQVDGRCATLWEELPPHRAGTGAELAKLLKDLHQLPHPARDLGLRPLDPFVRLEARISAASALTDDERRWLLEHLASLREQWATLPPGMDLCVLHGDAWYGNVAVTENGTAYLLDFERTAIGPPEWDLTATAVDHETLDALSQDQYRDFRTAYGHDVMTWPGYPTLRGIRELRKVTFAFQLANQRPSALERARHRLACIQGQRGPRPWTWPPAA